MASSKDVINTENGVVEARVYKCRKCGKVFNEFSWSGASCRAPQFFTRAGAKRTKRLNDAQVAIEKALGPSVDFSREAHGTPEERMAALKTLFAPVQKLERDKKLGLIKKEESES
jgi:hypothetical protein